MSTGPKNDEIRLLFRDELKSTRDKLLELIDPRLSWFLSPEKLVEMSGCKETGISAMLTPESEISDEDLNMIWGRFNNKKRKRQFLQKISAFQKDPRISLFLNEDNNAFTIITAFIRAHRFLKQQDNELSRRR